MKFYHSVTIIDNYDSYTHNLKQLLDEAGAQNITIMLCDQIDWDILNKSDLIVLSPGPGIPEESGQLMEVIERYETSKPILGICLGMQAIVCHFDGDLVNLKTVHHGESSQLKLQNSGPGLFGRIPQPIYVGRYHSWAVDSLSFPDQLEVMATTSDECIMAMRHKKLPIWGFQFHPESILTPYGLQMVQLMYQTQH